MEAHLLIPERPYESLDVYPTNGGGRALGKARAFDELKGAPRSGPVPVPKFVDIRNSEAIYDEKQKRKQPDWTYA